MTPFQAGDQIETSSIMGLHHPPGLCHPIWQPTSRTWLFKLIKILKFSYSSYISTSWEPSVSSDYQIGQHKYKICHCHRKFCWKALPQDGTVLYTVISIQPARERAFFSPPKIQQNRRRRFQEFSSSLSYGAIDQRIIFSEYRRYYMI